MPDLNGCDYIVSMWHKAGMINRGGMATAPLTWPDIDAFSRFNYVNSFEALMIIEMSRSFVSGLNMKNESDRAPYTFTYTEEDWNARSRSIDNQFRKADSDIKNAAR